MDPIKGGHPTLFPKFHDEPVFFCFVLLVVVVSKFHDEPVFLSVVFLLFYVFLALVSVLVFLTNFFFFRNHSLLHTKKEGLVPFKFSGK